jgi:hypothetical protein
MRRAAVLRKQHAAQMLGESASEQHYITLSFCQVKPPQVRKLEFLLGYAMEQQHNTA